ncbi:uncharacterized protein UV8b_00277 [Ustilaginoidea virens]|uniref:Cerato-platanin n=1 Tax=Ustilaginoidea virens TaxID=1159556 RepID=A0A8E5MDE3_USTVR|nr:uncharacterized protein UV8b_00277 [Ustilaginoidea virens]QUC16036.1 hypothetical protein UV8b_00277 [Ustilaginoidea virens]
MRIPSPAAKRADGTAIWATPHDSYSSSVGVLGCKINTDRVAYWPQPVDCDGICVSVRYQDRQVYLLRVDQSGGAHDMSYDAWNYLYTGEPATEKPAAGGAVEMHYTPVDASHCAPLIHTEHHRLPLSAANSMNFLASCLERPASWVASNYVLFNIDDPICTLGLDEQCSLDWPGANQPSCPHVLGEQTVLRDEPVYNIQYPSGKRVLASSGASGAPVPGSGGSGKDEENAAAAAAAAVARGLLRGRHGGRLLLGMVICALFAA